MKSCLDCGETELEFIDFYGIPIWDDQIFIIGEILVCAECGIPMYYDHDKSKLGKEVPDVLLGGS